MMQDAAPCHIGEACKSTGETGLKKDRADFDAAHEIANQIYGLNGTPEQCVNDQVHKTNLSDLQEFVNDIIGRG